MIKIHQFVPIIFWAAILTAFFPAQNADAEEGSCYLKATHTDVYVKVFDLDREGNMGNLIWQGRINQNETARIKTPHAHFRYYYNAEPDEDQPLSGGNDRSCNNLETILVP